MKQGKWMAGMVLAGLLAAPCGAGEFQLGTRFGLTNLNIDDDRMRSGEDASGRGTAFGLSAAYRTDPGLLIEATIMGSVNLSEEVLSGTVHKSLAAGWQFDVENWRITPKIGITHSYLDAEGGRELLEDGRPSERFTDTVPFIEATFERRVWRRFAWGGFVRHHFEDFGDSQAIGFSMSLYFD
jgi:hypothetical protein